MAKLVKSSRRLWPALFTLAGCALLVLLGVWQLHRLTWKQHVIGQIETRARAGPETLPAQETWPSLRPDDYDYRHVRTQGQFENDKETLVLHPSGSEPGYHVLTPLRLTSGGYVIVNRGFVPARLKDQSTRREGLIEGGTVITGLMRRPEARSFFTPQDDPAKGQWFTRDPEPIARHLGLTPAAPFLIDADVSPVPGNWPRGGTAVLKLPNNHLSYAITWFTLAAALFGTFAAYAWKNRTRPA